jgi:hypothetical protein
MIAMIDYQSTLLGRTEVAEGTWHFSLKSQPILYSRQGNIST